ncbi:hypothetical protein DL96DRAFT_1780024, partial [Flagelloscypha sp. PMI_526]
VHHRPPPENLGWPPLARTPDNPISLTINARNTPILMISTSLDHLSAPPDLKVDVGSHFLGAFHRYSQESFSLDPLETQRVVRKSAAWSLFSSLSPYLQHLEPLPQSKSSPFCSLLIETRSWSISVLLSRKKLLRLRGSPPIKYVNPNSSTRTLMYHPTVEDADIRIEFQDLAPHSPHISGFAPEDDSDSVKLDAASAIFPFTMDLFQSSEHIFLSETQDCQLQSRDLSVVLWLNALSGATQLRELDLRVSEKTLKVLRTVLVGLGEGGSERTEVTLPHLESMGFWEYRFLSRDCPLPSRDQELDKHSQPTLPPSRHEFLQHTSSN